MRTVKLQPYDLCQHQWLPMVAVMADTLWIQGKDLFYGSAFPNAGHPDNSKPGGVWAESLYEMIALPP